MTFHSLVLAMLSYLTLTNQYSAQNLQPKKLEFNKDYNIVVSGYDYNGSFDKDRFFDLSSDSVWTRGNDGYTEWSLTEENPNNTQQKVLSRFNPNITSALPLNFDVDQYGKNAITSFGPEVIEVANLEEKKAHTFRFSSPQKSKDALAVAIDDDGLKYIGSSNVITILDRNRRYNLSQDVPKNSTITALENKPLIGLAALYQGDKENQVIVWDPKNKKQRMKTGPFNRDLSLLPDLFDFNLNEIIVKTGNNKLTLFSKINITSSNTKSTEFYIELPSKKESNFNQLLAPTFLNENTIATLYLSPSGDNHCSPRTITFRLNKEDGTISYRRELMSGTPVKCEESMAPDAKFQLYFDERKNILNSMSNQGTSQFDILSIGPKK